MPEERWSSPSMAQTMPDHLPMSGKVALITGGTGGIGKATAIGLAGLGAQVGITGRDLPRAERAAADIRTTSGNPAVDAFAADMSSQAGLPPPSWAPTRGWTCWSTTSADFGHTDTRPPTGWSTRSL